MRKEKSFAFMLCALLLSSCGVYKDYQQTTTIPQDVYGQVQVQSGDNLAATSWQQLFTDTQLQSLIETALQHNTDAQTSLLRIEQAEIGYRTANLAYLPTAAFSPTGGVTKLGSSKAEWTYSLGVTASWQLDVFGAGITNSKRKSKANLQYTQDLEQATKCRLVSSVAQLYYQLQALDSQLEIQQRMLALYQKTYDSTVTLYEVGQYTSAAVHQTKADLEALKASILDTQNSMLDLEHSMCQLLDEPMHSIERSKIGSLQIPSSLAIGLPADLLQYRPDVRAAERSMQVAYYDLQLSKGALYPSITLTADGVWDGSWIIKGIGSLTQPIFQGGKLLANVKSAKIDQQVALLNFRKTVIDAGHEVTQALSHCQLANQKVSLLQEQVKQYGLAVEATQELMNHGTKSYLEVITALQELLKAQIAEVENYSYGAQSLVQLYAALGGGAL